MAKTYNRTVRVYLDNSEIENTVPSIQKRIRELTRDIKKMTIGTEEYERTAKSIADLNKILSDHRKAIRATSEEAKTFGSVLGKGADFINKWYYSAQSALQLFVKVQNVARQYVEDYARMEESMADVRKYTGQSNEEVHQMNEDFKRMDTRTAREQLNELAGSAGRLGITNKEMVEEFVDGADKINVALGDDLGEGAVDKIGKLAHMFGEDETKGLRGAMLATGSAVNDLAQSSSANAGYIVDFTADLSGVAIQAGFTQTQIMGLASALDQNMQEEATASTVFSQLITKMYQEPARFAELAGENVKDFTKLLKTDANAALLKFLGAMKEQGGFDKMAPMFEEMKLDGTRAVGVLSSVASHLDQVTEAQEIANKAYSDGTSVLDEFNVQNNTVQARLDKAKKHFHDISVELGEKLLPLVEHGISLGTSVAGAISAIVSIFLKYNTTILTATALLTTYIVLEKTDVAIKKLQVFWNDKVITGIKNLKIAMMQNPWTAAATAILVAIAVIKDWIDSVDDATEKENDLAEVHKNAAVEMEGEKSKLMALVSVARNKALSDQERKVAIEEINKLSPEYLGWLTNENISTRAATRAIENYTQSLYLNAQAKALQMKLEEIEKKKLDAKDSDHTEWYDWITTGFNDLLRNVEKGRNALQTLFSHGNLKGWDYTTSLEKEGYAFNSLEAATIRYGNAISALDKQQAAYRKALRENQKELAKLEAQRIADEKQRENGSRKGNGKGNHYTSPEEAAKKAKALERARGKAETDARKKTQKELDSITTEYENKRSEVKKQYLDGEIETEQEYNRKIEDLEIEELNKKLDVANLEPKKKAEIQQKILEYKIKLLDKIKEIDKKYDATEEERHAAELAQLKEQYDNDLATLDDAHKKGLLSEEAYQEKLKKLKAKYTADTEKADKDSAERIIKDSQTKFEALLDAQERESIKAGKLDKISQGERAKLWKEYLEKQLDELNLNGEQKAEILKEIEKADTDATEEELEKRQQKYEDYYHTVADLASQAGEQLGELLGNLLTGQKASIKEFLKSILSMTLDALKQTMVMAIAKRTIDNISTLGLAGIAKAAAEIALITAAFETAKTAIGNFAVGGFTSSGPWDRPQGIVHSNEFVANRFATANPNILPILNLIDAAQRSGSVSRLSAEDVAAVVPMARNGGHSVMQRTANGMASGASGDAALYSVLARVVRSLDGIDRRFSQPIVAETYATGKHGTIEAEKLVNKMKSNVKRKRR
ncbi:phage tail tape measure protein [Prevotella pectinovora]|uniref:phage tail tape measure protein n=1 Tax=Prevotella pectinovora TaxID=1602169 RepID=UPI00307A342C